MKKYIYLSLLVMFALVGANFVYAEETTANEADTSVTSVEGSTTPVSNTMAKPPLRPMVKKEMMKREMEDDTRERMLENKDSRPMKSEMKEKIGEKREDIKNMTKEEKENLKEKMKENKELIKEKAKEVKELLKKDNNGERVKAFLRFDAAIERMNTLASRVESRITKLAGEGADTSAATAEVAKAKTSIANAKTKFDELKTKLQTVNSTETTSDENATDADTKTDNKAFRAETAPLVKAIKDELVNAQKSLIKAVKILRDNAKSTSTASDTSTTETTN